VRYVDQVTILPLYILIFETEMEDELINTRAPLPSSPPLTFSILYMKQELHQCQFNLKFFNRLHFTHKTEILMKTGTQTFIFFFFLCGR